MARLLLRHDEAGGAHVVAPVAASRARGLLDDYFGGALDARDGGETTTAGAFFPREAWRAAEHSGRAAAPLWRAIGFAMAPIRLQSWLRAIALSASLAA